MKTNYSAKSSRVLSTLVLLMAFHLLVKAQPGLSSSDPFVFTDDGVYEVTTAHNNRAVYAIYEAKGDGVLTITVPGNINFTLYTDATYTTMAENSRQPVWNNSYSPRAYELAVEKGNCYYLKDEFVMSTGIIITSFSKQAAALSLNAVTPSDGSKLNAGSAYIGLEFNRSVSCAAASIKGGGKEVALNVEGSGATISLDARSALMQLYEQEAITEGSAIQLVLQGVCQQNNTSNLYNGDGIITLQYIADKRPIRIIATNNVPGGSPVDLQTFTSYFMKSDESKGIVQITFDAPVCFEEGYSPVAFIQYGSIENEMDSYKETLSCVSTNEGKTIEVDFRGVRRAAKDMTPSSTNVHDNMVLGFVNVRGLDKAYAYSTGSGTQGSFYYTYAYKEVNYSPLVDLTPASGSKVQRGQDIEMWLCESDSKSVFTGACFTYIHNGDTITKDAAIRITADEFDKDAKIVNITVPQIDADYAGEVTLTLTDLETPDGNTHDNVLTAKYVIDNASGISIIRTISDAASRIYDISGRQIPSASSRHNSNLIIINGKKAICK
ncbi:MAG: hypothetical protein ACI4BA_06040 [Prevotella sp.]